MIEHGFQTLVHIRQHNIALLFANYLSTLEIKSQVIDEVQGYAIYCPEDKMSMAKQVFEEFIQQPHHPKYQQAAWQYGEVSDVVNHGPSFSTTFKQQFLAHAGIVSLTIFSICWCVFLMSEMGWKQSIFQWLHFYPQLSLDALIHDPLRLLGPAFFHFSWLHIVFNTMWWWQLGGSIEKSLGKMALFNLFIISAIVSNLGQFLDSGPQFGGLSGVVYALVGYVWWMGWLAPEKGLSLSKSIIGFLLFWILLGYTNILPVNMANTAHVLGLITGCLLAVFTAKVHKNGKDKK